MKLPALFLSFLLVFLLAVFLPNPALANQFIIIEKDRISIAGVVNNSVVFTGFDKEYYREQGGLWTLKETKDFDGAPISGEYSLPAGMYSQSACSPAARDKVVAEDVWQGAHCRFFWAQVMPREGVFDFDILDNYINSIVSRDKKVIIGAIPRADDSDPMNIGAHGAPCWMIENSRYDPIFGGIRGECARAGQINYANSNVRQAYAEWVDEVVERYKDNPNVGFEIGAGHQGEFRPVSATNTSDRNHYLDKWRNNPGGARRTWQEWGYFSAKTWADAIERHNAQNMVYMIATGHFTGIQEWSQEFIVDSHCNDCNLVDYLVAREIGLKSTGIRGDTGRYNGRIGADGGHDYNAWQLALSNNSHLVPVIGENGVSGGLSGFDGRLRNPLSFYWGMLKCLDLGCYQLHLPGGRINEDEANQWMPSNHVESFRFFMDHTGKSAAETPSAWVVLRTTENYNDEDNWCARGNCDNNDFSFYMDLLRNAQGGVLIPEFSISPTDDLRSRFVKRTDVINGNRRAYFVLDTDFVNSLSGSVTVIVTYLERSGGDGFTLTYQSVGGPKTVERNTSGETKNTWREARFTINDYSFDKGLPNGSDIFIDSRNQNLWLHMVRVER